MSLLLPGLAFIAGVISAAITGSVTAAKPHSCVAVHDDGSCLAASTWPLVAACLLVGPALLVLAQTRRDGSYRTRALLAAAALALAAGHVHAALAFSAAPEPWWPPEIGVVDLVVDGASSPGARCTVDAHPRRVGPQVGAPTSAMGSVRVELPADACPLSEGQIIGVASSTLRRSPEPPAWLRSGEAELGGARVGLRGEVWFRRGVELLPGRRWRVVYWAAVARLRQSLLEAARGDEARGFVVASTLGQRAALSRAATASLRGAGLWHVVSVSGLHVAVASMLALALGLRMCALVGSRPAWAVLGAWTFVAAYVALTGASAPAVRAGIMSAWLGLGIMVGRPTHGLTTLVLALASMLAVRPTWIAEPGFQLSAVAMAALVTADRRAGLIAQSWRLTWALAPLCLWWFGELSLVGVLLNVVAVPVFTVVVLPAGLIGGLLTPWWGAPALEVAAAGARLILDLAALAATLPTAGRTATAALAGGLLLLKGVRRWRSPPGMLRQPLATVAPSLGRRALDGLLGAPSVALVTVLLVAGSHADAGGPSRHALQQVMGGRSYGIGDPTHRALVVDRPGGGACIDVSRASSLAWARWLEALGMPRPWIVVGRDPVSNEARVRLGGETDDGRCAVVFTRAREPVTGLGGTLRSCRRLGAASPAIVRTDRVTQRWHCAMSSGWRPVP